jgi:hypothetical protein
VQGGRSCRAAAGCGLGRVRQLQCAQGHSRLQGQLHRLHRRVQHRVLALLQGLPVWGLGHAAVATLGGAWRAVQGQHVGNRDGPAAPVQSSVSLGLGAHANSRGGLARGHRLSVVAACTLTTTPPWAAAGDHALGPW